MCRPPIGARWTYVIGPFQGKMTGTQAAEQRGSVGICWSCLLCLACMRHFAKDNCEKIELRFLLLVRLLDHRQS